MSVTGPAREKTSAPEAELALSQIPTDAESQVKEEGDPPGRWRALVLLGFSVLCGLSTWYSANTVIPDLEREWGLSGGLSVWLSAVVPVGFVIGALCSAWWSVVDRVGGRRFIALGCLASAVCNGLMACGVWVGGQGWWFGIAVILRGLTGAALAAVYPPSMKVMATWFRYGRGLALGVMVGWVCLGFGFPWLVRGLLDLNDYRIQWYFVLLATSGLALMGGGIAEFVVRDGPFEFPRATFDPKKAGLLFTDRSLLLATLGYVGHNIELFSMWNWFADFWISQVPSMGRTESFFFTFGVVGIGAVGCALGGIFGDRYGRTTFCIISLAVSSLCSLVIGVVTKTPGALGWSVFIALLWGMFIIADSGCYSTMTVELAPAQYVGTLLTMQQAIGFIATVPTISLIPTVRSAISYQWAFAVIAPAPILAFVAMVGLRMLPESKKIAMGRK